jgi:hypothetical protein
MLLVLTRFTEKHKVVQKISEYIYILLGIVFGSNKGWFSLIFKSFVSYLQPLYWRQNL